MLPMAMVSGIIFHKWIDTLTPLSLLLIFLMLTITYCRIRPSDLKIGKFHWQMLIAQMLLSAITYFMLLPFGNIVASGVFICVFIPTATAAPIVTGMLGGSVSHVATYSLLCNLAVAALGPLILAAIGDHAEMTFYESFLMICKKVLPLLLLPMIAAFLMRKYFRKVYDTIASHQSLSFYLWSVALFIVIGSSASFVINRFTPSLAPIMVSLAIGSGIVCVLQFYIGHKIGKRFNQSISGTQSLGQKNTILAVWLSLTYLDPIASIAPATYMAWHNILNSWQIARKK